MITTARLLLAAVAVSALAACPAEPPPPPPLPLPPPVEVKPVDPPKPVLAPYEPAGEFADIKKAAAAGIDENTAAAKAAEVETALDTAITELEAKAKAPAKKK
jgi:hypothetical protein